MACGGDESLDAFAARGVDAGVAKHSRSPVGAAALIVPSRRVEQQRSRHPRGNRTVYVARLLELGRDHFADVVDLGAHIGGFSIHVALNARIDGAVFAAEPEPDNFGLLRTNLAANGLDGRVEALNAAASDRPGRARLALSPTDNTGGHFLTSHPDRDALDVDTVDVLQLAGRCSPGSLLKIDIEGWEYPIFRRLRTRLSVFDAIVGELHSSRWVRPNDCLAILRRAGFQVSTFGDPRIPSFVALRKSPTGVRKEAARALNPLRSI